ncbi:hypothetical protein JR316_0001861 [Psilocybe cubensis]|uniref:Uncharacterized protein n=2 Tax=Psilocybe cubensis TaxID=181762 RepID=A0A8H8CMY3_PSICU|nr:hypothetical protein JR316_0001861 [Psilocybe cubensis]KAH9484957.1 hypothetical protein JR316_0001861 [Psilocybe cubensis]
MHLPFNLPDPSAPFQKTLDLAKLNEKARKEKEEPIPPGVALFPPGFFLPLEKVEPLYPPTPPPVVFIGNVIKAKIDEEVREHQARVEAKARETDGQADQLEPLFVMPLPEEKTTRKKSKREKEEDEKKAKEKPKKVLPEYPMVQYMDRDDHPTYNGRFLKLQKRCGNIRVVGPEYCFGLAERNFDVDYEDPRRPPPPTSRPLTTNWPVNPLDGPPPKKSKPRPFVPKFKPDIYVANVTKWPEIPRSFGNQHEDAVVLPTEYKPYPTLLRAQLVPPAPASEERDVEKREQLAKHLDSEVSSHQVDHLASDSSAGSTSADSFHTATLSSNTTERTSSSTPYFLHRTPKARDRNANEHGQLQKPFTPFATPAPQDTCMPSEIKFSPPAAWLQSSTPDKHAQESPSSPQNWESAGSKTTKVFNIGAVDASKLKLGSDARLKDGPENRRAVVQRAPSTSSRVVENSETVTPPRVARPPKATHTRQGSRQAIYFTDEQIAGVALASSPSPPTPPPKDTPYLAQIPPYKPKESEIQSKPNPPAFQKRSSSPTPGPNHGTTLPLRIHKRNPSNPLAKDPRDVFDYASVTTSRAEPQAKPQGPPPVLRHHGHVRIVRPPSRNESLPINVKSNARPSTSTTKFRTPLDHEIRANSHNRSASEKTNKPQSHGIEEPRPEYNRSTSALGHHRRNHSVAQPRPIADVVRPDHSRSSSALGHYHEQLRTPAVHHRPEMSRSQSPSMSTPNYGTRAYMSSTTSGRSKALPGSGHVRNVSEFGNIQYSASFSHQTPPHLSNTATVSQRRPRWA